jgi:hypothetical protein
MRWAGLLLLAATLAACEAKAPDAPATVGGASAKTACTEPVRKEVAFTAPGAKDIFEISAIGAECKEAVVLTTIRSASGAQLWSHSDVASQTMAFAGIEQTSDTPAQALHKTMQAWADAVTTSTSADAPDWKEGAERPEEATGLYIGTDFPRDQYLAARTEARPMLCHPVYMNRTQCIIYYGDGAYTAAYYDMRS